MGTQHQNKHNPHAQETPAPLKDTMVSKTNSQMKGQKKKKKPTKSSLLVSLLLKKDLFKEYKSFQVTG